MSTAFAAAEARLGSSVLRRLGNASITLADATVIDGMLRDVGRDAPVGMGMQARDIEFACSLESGDAIPDNALVTLTYRGVSAQYRIAESLPDDLHLRHAIFALRRTS